MIRTRKRNAYNRANAPKCTKWDVSVKKCLHEINQHVQKEVRSLLKRYLLAHWRTHPCERPNNWNECCFYPFSSVFIASKLSFIDSLLSRLSRSREAPFTLDSLNRSYKGPTPSVSLPPPLAFLRYFYRHWSKCEYHERFKVPDPFVWRLSESKPHPLKRVERR